MRCRGRAVSVGDLIESVWESDSDIFTNAVKVHINSMRKKLPAGIIKTAKGQGYYVE